MTTQDDRGAVVLSRAHGFFTIAGGLWPLLHPTSFDKVFGPTTDRRLRRTVAGLLVGIGWTQVRAAGTPDGAGQARRLGMATAATLLTADLLRVPTGRIRPAFLLDAAAHALWLRAWRAAPYGPSPGRAAVRGRSSPRRRPSRPGVPPAARWPRGCCGARRSRRCPN